MSTARTINLDDEAPNTGTTENTGPATAPPRTPSITKLETQVKDFYTQLGTYAGIMAPDPFPGMMIVNNAEAAASAWADLAAQNPEVKRTIEKLLTGGVWANVIGIHLAGIVAPVLAYYGKLPEQISAMVMMGVVQQNPELEPLVIARNLRRDGHNVQHVPAQ